LLLGERQAQSPQGAGQRLGGYRLGPNQVSGAINISRLTNISFQDKSGREGIQENVVFDVFKQVITNLIAQIERDRNIVMFTISQIFKKKNKEAEAIRKADELAKKAIEDAQKADQATNENEAPTDNQESSDTGGESNPSADAPDDPNLNQVVLHLAKGFQAQKTEIQEKDDEIRLLRALAGTGLIVASFAHELRNISPLLVTRVESLETILRNKVDSNAFKDLKDYEQPMTILADIKGQDKLIKHWLEYALSALKKDKRTRTNIDLIDYFYGYESKWKSILDKRLITMTFHKPQKIRPSLRGFTVDLDTIFNNMLTNSLESFKKLKAKTERKIHIRLSADEENINIEFEDNGAGLSKDFRNPDDIFLPFETSKVDKSGQKTGTGIGMYLTKSIIEDYEGSIKVLKAEPGFNLGITLPIKFKRNGTE
jgi:C4-dicarboxylate-specific signal transduction histidine kinase